MTSIDRVPDLDSLRLLSRIASSGSLGRAAAEHGITQPAVSARLRNVERLVGVEVVARGQHGSQLTADGALLVDWARDLLDAAEALGAGIEALRTVGSTEVVRVAATTTVAEHLVPRWLARLEVGSGGIRLATLAPDEVLPAVLSGAATLGFVEDRLGVSTVDEQVVARDELVVVVPPRHPWALLGRPLTPAELVDEPLVHREPGSGPRRSFELAVRRALGEASLPAPRLELSTASAVRAAVLAGAGPAVLSNLAVEDDVTAGLVTRVVVEDLDLTRRLRAVWPRGRRPAGTARDLLRVAVRSDVWIPPLRTY